MKARAHSVRKNQRLQRSQVSSCALLLSCYMAPSLKAQLTEQVAAHGLPPNKLNCTVILVAKIRRKTLPPHGQQRCQAGCACSKHHDSIQTQKVDLVVMVECTLSPDSGKGARRVAHQLHMHVFQAATWQGLARTIIEQNAAASIETPEYTEGPLQQGCKRPPWLQAHRGWTGH